MKKVIYSILAMTLGLCALTGCEKGEKKNLAEITYQHGNGTIKLSVPKNEDGTAKYEFTTEKPERISVSKTFYLVTDNTILGFSTSGMSYASSSKYKEKYGDKKATFDGYLEFIEDTEMFNKSYLPGLEQFEINGRKALRYYNRVGGSGDYKYYGYFYMVGADDIYPGSKFDMVVNYKDTEKPKEIREFDEETLEIIKSLKIEANK